MLWGQASGILSYDWISLSFVTDDVRLRAYKIRQSVTNYSKCMRPLHISSYFTDCLPICRLENKMGTVRKNQRVKCSGLEYNNIVEIVGRHFCNMHRIWIGREHTDIKEFLIEDWAYKLPLH